MFYHLTAGRETRHPHTSVQEAVDCQTQFEIDEADAQWAASELYAENAAVRAAEAGTPETWREEDLDRMVDALGYGPPPGFQL
jgi:hypothetical protein